MVANLSKANQLFAFASHLARPSHQGGVIDKEGPILLGAIFDLSLIPNFCMYVFVLLANTQGERGLKLSTHCRCRQKMP
jgi:hypothetical protein